MLSLLLATALEFTALEARFSLSTACELVARHAVRDAGTTNALAAAGFLAETARSEDLAAERDVFRAPTPRGERTFANVYARIVSAEPSAEWIVLVSHFDTKRGCPGANDGASTSGLLFALARSFARAKPPQANLMLVWTDGEECMDAYGRNDGLWGSRRAAERLAGYRVRAVICLDMLGDRDLSIVIPANGTAALRATVLRAAEKASLARLVRPIDGHVIDDHVAFLERGFAAVDLIDFDYGPNNSLWHTANDTPDRLSEESLLKSGRLAAETINLLL